MNPRIRTLPLGAPTSVALALGIVCLAFLAGPALADRDDRSKPVSLSFKSRGEADLAKRRTEIVGDVILSQGATLLRAERATIRETPDGFYQATARGTAVKPVFFHQDLLTPRQAVEGTSEELEYDASRDTARLAGNARMKQLDGTRVTMELTGASAVFDKRSDVIAVEGGSTSPNPDGRGRILLMPVPAKEADDRDAPEALALTLRPTLTLSAR